MFFSGLPHSSQRLLEDEVRQIFHLVVRCLPVNGTAVNNGIRCRNTVCSLELLLFSQSSAPEPESLLFPLPFAMYRTVLTIRND